MIRPSALKSRSCSSPRQRIGSGLATDTSSRENIMLLLVIGIVGTSVAISAWSVLIFLNSAASNGVSRAVTDFFHTLGL